MCPREAALERLHPGEEGLMRRCPQCGRFIKDELTHKEQFKSIFMPRNHGHGASNHGDRDMHELIRHQSRGTSDD
jgi:hypothetical protein